MWVAWSVLSTPLGDTGVAHAAEPLFGAELECPTRAGPGRLVCHLRLRARADVRLRWADALVVAAPDFAPPLRSRVAASLPEEGAQEVSIPLPLYAREENTGTLRVRARAVVCAVASAEGDDCSSASREVEAAVAVVQGPPSNGSSP